MLLLLQNILTENSLIRLVLGSKRKKSNPCQRVVIRPFSMKDEIMYQAEYVYEKKASHENLDKDQLLQLFCTLIENDFKQANIFTIDSDYQILASKPNQPKITKKTATKAPQNLSHNYKKNYMIEDGSPCDFLIRLGVMNDEGLVLKKHYGKFRQINRFLEIVRDIISYLPSNKRIKIIDFGCGKAYLTFALFYYLKKIERQDIEMIGLDLKEDVVAFCNNIAIDLGYDELHFEVGDIAKYQDVSTDMVVTLHACDTATDYALINAYKWNAAVILSVPCCQHELFNQMKNELHNPMLKQGILRERFCAILTDTIRTLKLESWGYDVSMVEFTSLEHTAKNIMIRAIKSQPRKEAKREYEALLAYWNIDPTIVREDV